MNIVSKPGIGLFGNVMIVDMMEKVIILIIVKVTKNGQIIGLKDAIDYIFIHSSEIEQKIICIDIISILLLMI